MQVIKESATTKYNARLNEILKIASGVFAEKGYHKASIRDISRESGISLAGLYYYFTTKEELLFLISQYSFESVLESLEKELQKKSSGREKLAFLIRNHISFFVKNLDAMKVLSHESDSLTGDFAQTINELKKRYIKIVEEILNQLRGTGNGQDDPATVRVEALALFGMMNWIYTWYNPKKDTLDSVSAAITRIFFDGVKHSSR